MSSPIGGFYLNAQYRNKAAKSELTSKPRITLKLRITLDGIPLIDETQTGIAETRCHLDNDHISVTALPTLISDEMIRLEFHILIKHLDSDIATPKQQVLNLELGESLCVLVEGDERLKITTSCSITP
ncbi:hypothetical protein FM037_04345 [Shewanella psychropiezotolerans]|uniref:Uncharacterized protein n=1 Tax=Shewanella psychropiezotolerans TaxID=2593655 RepID=A0ABX5WUX5_9GAMM|nr:MULTISPECIES: hypothetical protein [Shewanella]MPY22930.1 hypothetical protein [Shewanella sp. YLB-07]QDO82606.1 hypothetical protein FM037_04345 [Shewanella psychropiezotolerans]